MATTAVADDAVSEWKAEVEYYFNMVHARYATNAIVFFFDSVLSFVLFILVSIFMTGGQKFECHEGLCVGIWTLAGITGALKFIGIRSVFNVDDRSSDEDLDKFVVTLLQKSATDPEIMKRLVQSMGKHTKRSLFRSLARVEKL